MAQQKSTENLDRWGLGLSSLCTLHCILTPLAFALFPAANTVWHSPYLHWVLALILIPLGLFAFIRGYRLHGKISVPLTGALGLCLIFLATLDPIHYQEAQTALELFTHYGVNVSGSLLLIIAHFNNLKFCRCACCSVPQHSR